MTRGRMAVLALVVAATAGAAGWWLLRGPGEPPPVPPTPRSLPEPAPSSGEVISRLRREIEQLRQGGKSRVVYRVGTGDELEAYRRWVDSQLRFATRAQPPEAPVPQGFRLLELSDAAVILAETPDEKRGAGAVVLRRGEAQPWVLEVPHSFFDEGTLEIGLNAFVWSQARALLVNTVHRYRSLNTEAAEGGEADDDEQSASSDVAHAEASFFLSAHTACVDTLGDVRVVQLHGFSDGSAPSADLVLSPAGSNADPEPAAQALTRALGIRVAVYPKQIRRLGGTKNRQAHYSIAANRPFLHVEISRSLRKRLTSDPEQLQRFVQALLGSGA
jgi:hypothetical protein